MSKILLVDDSATMLTSMGQLIGNLGHNVVTAESGRGRTKQDWLCQRL